MIRVLHTADWHIGQLFYEYDRSNEHRQFLEWLLKTLSGEEVDLLLVSGDIFDVSNPSASSIRMFYSFLNRAITENPNLQIIVTAGNHDSASRLESPKPLLESSNVHIVGVVGKDEDGRIRYEDIVIPVNDKNGRAGAWCVSAPFLRLGDYPSVPESKNPYADGIAQFYREACGFASKLKTNDQAIIAMGHLHAKQAELSDMDKTERLIMGGMEAISASDLDENIRYMALGHIHKAQRVGGRNNVRYSGSPLPMSFSETNYRHQVILFDISNDSIENIRTKEIPVSVPLKRIPSAPRLLRDVIAELENLSPYEGDLSTSPFLEVRVLLEGPEPGLRHRIERALEGKNHRLAKIDVHYPAIDSKSKAGGSTQTEQLNEIRPADLLERLYLNKFEKPLPDELQRLFRRVEQEVNETEKNN